MGKRAESFADELILHVRHRAWLAARPGKGENLPSRSERFLAEEASGEDRPQLILPYLEQGQAHLVDHLFDIGPSTGGEVISHQEIRAWMANTGHHLTGWECSMLRRLSSAFLAEYDAAKDPNRPAPFMLVTKSRAQIADGLLALFQGMAEAEPKKGGA